MFVGGLISLLQFFSSILRRAKRRSIDSRNFSTVPCNQRYFRFSIGSKISGKSSNLKLPVRSSSSRYFNLQMLVGRLISMLQFFSSILKRPTRFSIDLGNPLTAVPFNRRYFRFPIGSKISGKYSNLELPVRSSFTRDFNLQMLEGRSQKTLAIFQFNSNSESTAMLDFFRFSIGSKTSGKSLNLEQPVRSSCPRSFNL
ncbi:hypothetical protein DVH24_034606 [Malus domestica]|uniref:Uncharacterized protein n=1 Tax=Malus domestica TaxID=3750 RepID=A0A498IWZ7_MALDO|nr:hypothetical protein DVH24_034606 [Malus domestica]